MFFYLIFVKILEDGSSYYHAPLFSEKFVEVLPFVNWPQLYRFAETIFAKEAILLNSVFSVLYPAASRAAVRETRLSQRQRLLMGCHHWYGNKVPIYAAGLSSYKNKKTLSYSWCNSNESWEADKAQNDQVNGKTLGLKIQRLPPW